MKKSIGLEDAIALCSHWACPAGQEEVNLNAAFRRVSAQDLCAQLSVPDFDRSAVDGYAICQDDLAYTDEPRAFKVIGERSAGHCHPISISRGETLRVMTGALLPAGTAAVIKQEEVRPSGSLIYPVIQPRPGENIQQRGSDIPLGMNLLKAGEILEAEGIERIACCGVERLRVYRHPRIYIINTGNELVLPGMPLQPGQIYHSNRSLLAAKVASAGGTPVLAETGVRDEIAVIASAIEKGVSSADMVIISGGTGSGTGDLVQDSWRELGADILFKGIDIVPGKGSAAAAYRQKLICNLAGHPGAVSLLFEVLINPIFALLRGESHSREWFEIILDSTVHKISDRRSLRRAEMIFAGPGESRARPLSAFSNFCHHRLILDLKPGQGKAGEIVKALMI